MAEPTKVTITEFVTENDKVLAAIGVFVALAAFSLTLPIRTLSVSIAFASFVATFPLIFELTTKFLNRKWTISLIIFSNICGILWLRLALYVLIAFRDEWQYEMPKVVFWLIILPLYGLYKRGLRKWIDPPVNWILCRFEKYVLNIIVIFFDNVYGQSKLRLHLWRQRSKLSAFKRGRQLVREKKFNKDFDKAWAAKSELEWKEKPNEFPKWLVRGIFLLLPLLIVASEIQNPIARVINIGLDIEAEVYQVPQSKMEDLKTSVPPVHDAEPITTPTPIVP